MTDSNDFHVRFWGVRGSIAAPGAETVRYGGNTSSLEVRCGPHLLLFDGGTGIRHLGRALCSQAPIDADLYLTHTHFDHICGLPFFAPLFDPRNRIRIHAGHLLPELDIKHVLSEMMMSPLFPVPLGIFGAKPSFHDFRAGEVLHPHPGITIRTGRLSHPDRATAYRIDYGGRSVCYLTDTEHVPGEIDRDIVSMIEGADIAIYDSMFTEEEYACRRGWGHSTWQAGVALCDAARVKTFVAFHHDPDHDDACMDRIAAALEAARPGSLVAREGMILRP